MLTVSASEKPTILLKSDDDRFEIERLIKHLLPMTGERRIESASRYLLGRHYHPETKKRIKQQTGKPSKKVKKTEATNEKPLSVEFLRTSMQYLDCMTYVEHVLALANSSRPAYRDEFLCRLIDVMFNSDGGPLYNHQRSHFTSHWADVNEQKGYLKNVARNHPMATSRTLLLNKVGNNRTFYVEDRFMISTQPKTVWYFDRKTVLAGKADLQSGDILALVTDKEGLDVTHMAFFIVKNKKKWLRHASLKLNRIVDQDFNQYLKDHESVKGLMVMRPVFNEKEYFKFNFKLQPDK
ncbi:MAG: N-acetylmuramoyl-L-alanine amidase-like domain-containing protein [Candidatus Rifleibacteriota bacterium]